MHGDNHQRTYQQIRNVFMPDESEQGVLYRQTPPGIAVSRGFVRR